MKRIGTIGALTILCAFIAAGVYIATEAGKQGAIKVSSDVLATNCPRNQLQRAWLRVRAYENPSRTSFKADAITLTNQYFRTVDCERQYTAGRTGGTVYLPDDADMCFLQLTRYGYWHDRRPPTTNVKKLRKICQGRNFRPLG